MASRAGLQLQLLNVPRHVVARFVWGGDGGGGAAYVDVFERGRVMDEAQMDAFLASLGQHGVAGRGGGGQGRTAAPPGLHRACALGSLAEHPPPSPSPKACAPQSCRP